MNFTPLLSIDAISHLCLCSIMLEMTYFRAEVVQLQMQLSAEVTQNKRRDNRHGMILSCWKMNCE